jgi:hypothetical protein
MNANRHLFMYFLSRWRWSKWAMTTGGLTFRLGRKE